MEKNQRDFFARLEAKLSCLHEANEEWIDGLEVQGLLGVTRKTVYRLTMNGTLEPKRIGRRNYYSRSSIFKLRDRFLK
ncbi:MAG: helix-turn-helix domain-containing protein [Daejeonella sp.]